MIKIRLLNVLTLLVAVNVLTFSCAAFSQFSAVDQLSNSRSEHTTTLLNDGRLLVVGGFNGSSLSSVEIYDPVADEWSLANSLNFARSGHAATKLANGKVIVSGGRVNFGLTTLSSVEIYDPVNNSWTAAESMNIGRNAHTSTLLNNGSVLVVGGTNLDLSGTGLTPSVEIYNPNTGSWTTVSSLSIARTSHTTTLLSAGKVLVAAGFVGNGVSGGDTAELYDIGNDEWTSAGDLSTQRSRHSASILANGKVLIVGGQRDSGASISSLASAELYDPTMNEWSSTSSLGVSRTRHRAILLEDGNVLITGGESGSGVINSTELYDAVTGRWSEAERMVFARARHSSNLLSNGDVIVVGGNDGNGNISSVELLSNQVIEPPLPSSEEDCYVLSLPEQRAVIFCL